jgi:GNAT superfamily N-acetyltransferase
MTTTNLILNLGLARRIELAEAQAAVETAEALERSRPGGAAIAQVAGGFAVYCGANSPVTQAVGLGLAGPVSEEEFERLENFYETRNEPVRVETCPLADHSLIDHFGRRNYRVTEFTNVLAKPIDRDGAEPWPAPAPGVSIEIPAPGDLRLWTLTVAQGFAESYPVTQELLEVMKMFASGAHATCYLARVEGKVAGGATLALRNGVAGLFGASTLPTFRGRGVQTALLHARLAHAAKAGSDLAVCLAQPGSISQRNVMRQGFQVLYTRVKFERDCSGAGCGTVLP